MNVLVRKEILDVLDEINQLSEKDFYLAKFIEDSDLNNAKSVAPVQFDINNCKLMAIDNPDLQELFDLYHIDANDMMLVSTFLAHGFINSMRGYYSTLEQLLTGKSDGNL